MPRAKRLNIKHLPPIALDMDDAFQKGLWEAYQRQTGRGNGQQWLRDTLLQALRLYRPKESELTYEDVNE